MEFSDIIKILRKKQKLSQYQLAEKLSVAQPVISEWENGGKLPHFEQLIKLSEALDISLDELMGQKENYQISILYKIEQLCHTGTITLEDLRKEFNETIDDLSKILGVSRNTLMNWEKNGLPNLDKYKKIIKHFNLDLEQFLELK